MAAIKLYFGDLENLPTQEFLEKIPIQYVFATLTDLAEYYEGQLSLASVLGKYGVHVHGGREEQVPCILPSHGSVDTHLSARYYPVDRETGEEKGAVYCFKCQRTMSSFWLFYNMEKENRPILDFFLYIEKLGVPFPKGIVLNYDPEQALALKTTQENESVKLLMKAIQIHESFARNTPEFAYSLHNLLN